VAKHVWLVEQYSPGTLADAALAAGVAIKGGLTEAAAVCRFVGYAVESVRQKGTGERLVGTGSGGVPVYEAHSVQLTWRGAVASKHRYAWGHNHHNYLLAGRRMLSQMDPATELVPGVPVGLILDKLIEELG
jgi:hypothetical protein